jgi:hypothetical protein
MGFNVFATDDAVCLTMTIIVSTVLVHVINVTKFGVKIPNRWFYSYFEDV